MDRTEVSAEGAIKEISDRRRSLNSRRRPCLLQLPVQRGRKQCYFRCWEQNATQGGTCVCLKTSLIGPF